MFSPQFDAELAVHIFRNMVRIQACDKAIQRGLASGALQFQYYPCGGQEAIPAAMAPLINRDDFFVTTYRGVHDVIAKGTPMSEVIAEMYGTAAGTSKGKGGPMHLSDPYSGLMVTTGIVGAGVPIANGLALAEQIRDSDKVTLCSFGDGAANIGAVHEALNMAALWQLPVVFVCQNNLYAEYTDFSASTRVKSIADRGAAYAMASASVDGTDPEAVYAAASEAIARARSGEGPTLLECVAPRLQGHSFGSDEGHMDAELLAEGRANPPLARFRTRVLKEGWATEELLADIEKEAAAEVSAAQEAADSAPEHESGEFFEDVYESASLLPGNYHAEAFDEPDLSNVERQITYAEAVNEALDLALSTDDSTLLLGEDIMDPAGGIVKATAGLSTKHGDARVRGTPISEQAIVGAAIGASLAGMKPIAEIMIVDFAMVCMDQIANHAAKLRYMSGGRTNVPITLRMLTAGSTGSFGAQHSQSLESWFAHVPGLKIACPSSPADVKGLLLSSIHDPDPCIIIEPMNCYFVPGPVPEGDYRIPFGKAKVLREGSDVTLLAYSWAVGEVAAAAETLAEQGVSAEVIDLRSVLPMDMDTVLASVRKTGRLLITHPAVEFCGVGAEIAAQVSEALFSELKAPVARYGAAYTPVPFSKVLEAQHFPNAAGVVERAARLVGA
ncbi:thiamine pyrophosphate-dependent enzyme [Congregibacter sp.]|jgi:pyruvate/2-oxoglutarate/acetoin dehydrogenase E1 component/TPP-dependent pyruvate/acetoin dehydrogenase alpha subunit|uniref:alpha-ketoacid dehydrogenase subunit alpha/beta n=1 Tax=Congregibacter sp. TaxID=2744308 RepID=UPI0039E2545E